MNRELLARVRDRIAEVGNEHCDMSDWLSGTATAEGEVSCGTTACIAGWTIAVANGEVSNPVDVAWDAGRLLDLPNDLFYKTFWPERYDRIAQDEGDAKGMLAICDALLDGSVIVNDSMELVEVDFVA